MRYSRAKILFVAAAICTLASPVRADPPTASEVIKYLQSLPPGTPIEFSQTTSTESAAGDGASATATGDKLDQSLDTSAPGAKLSGGASATGGDAKGNQTAEVFGFPWIKIVLILLGAACLAGAGYKATRIPPELDTAIGLGAAGLTLITIAFFPGLLILVALAAVAIAIPHFLPDKANKALAADAEKAKSALAAVVAGVHFAPDSAALAVKAEIAKQATPEDSDTIKAIKRTTLPT